MAQFTCDNLTIGYGSIPVTKNINFSINSGDYLCIVGENGVGKSTLINTLLGLIPKISGNIQMSDGLKPIDIGYLPQQTQAQKDFPALVFEVVISGCLNRSGLRPFYNKSEKKLAMQSLEKMGIEHLARKSYSKLSGGQQQRTLLARALCAANKVLLLDEPQAGLDSETSDEMYKLIKSLNDEGTTVIMITHDILSAKKYANYILEIGENAEFMTVEEYNKRAEGVNI